MPQYSAVVAGATNTEAIGLYKNHANLCKFDRAGDSDLNRILGFLSIMTREATTKIEERWRLYEYREGQISILYCKLK